MQKTNPTNAEFDTRAAQASDAYERIVRMARQSLETLDRAISAIGPDFEPSNREDAFHNIPELGLSPAGDRCREAELRVSFLLVTIAEESKNLIDEIERGPIEDLPTEEDKDRGRRLGALRESAGLTIGDIAEVLPCTFYDRTGLPVGFVEGVESGRYRAAASQVTEWVHCCGETMVDFLKTETPPLTDGQRKTWAWIDSGVAS